MTKSKSTRRALLFSMVSLFLCFTMLIGTTYAWFTDSVTSAGNVIKTGTLEVSLKHADKALTDPDDANWIDASTGAIFNYSNWEPGYTAVQYVKIENEGSLDLKFVLNIIPNNEAEEVNLADVIEVYMVSGAVAVDRAALTTDSDAYVGTLTSLMAETDGAAHGVLYADDADKAGNVYEIYTIALKMSESAGNEYQNKSVGGGFAVQLLATQLASESDDFDNHYDKDATYISAGTAEELQNAIAKGEPVTLTDDITMNAENFTVASGTNAVINLGGNDLTVTNTDSTAAFLNVQGDLTITGEGNVDVRQINTSEGSTLTLGEGVTISTSNSFAINNQGTTVIDGATINHTGTDHAILNDYGTLIINDATVTSTSTKNISTISSMTGTVIINGGTFVHEGSMGSVICDPYGDSEIIINGGTFIQKDGDPLVNMGMSGKLTVNGGTFDAESMFSNMDTDITINAGVFKNNATVTDYGFGSISSMIPATSTATTNADGSITVAVN